MKVRRLLDDPRLASARRHADRLYRSHRLRRFAAVAAIVLVVFGLLGFFAAPPLLRSQLQKRLAVQLGRPVTIGAVHLDPYTLRLQLDRLHIGEPRGAGAFVDIDQLVVNASWSSLFRRAPILDELILQHPQLHIVRLGPQQFNFTDLLQRFGGPTDPKAAPARFALANIRVHNGDIRFDDRLLNTSHRVDRIEIGIPFLANLPASADVFVKPLFAARVDGSPLRIEGQTKPFASSRESAIDFQLDRLDLPRYLSYVPTALPVAIPSGQLSGSLKLHFINSAKDTQLRLDGALLLDHLRLTTPDGTPMLELGHGAVELDDVQPLVSRYHLGLLQLDQLAVHDRSGADGHGNFDALTTTSPNQPTSPPGPPNDVRIGVLNLQQGHLDYTDAGAAGASASLDNLHGSVRGLSTLAAPAATLDMAAQLEGGTLHLAGRLDPARARFDGKLDIRGVGLAPLQPLAMPQLQASVADGQLTAEAQLNARWGSSVNLHLEPARFSISHFALHRGKSGDTPVAWKSVQADLSRFDLATSQAEVADVTVQGLKLDARRLRSGRLDLLALFAPATPVRLPPSRGKPVAPPAWRWHVGQLNLDDSDVTFKDLTAEHPMPVALHAEHYRIGNLSSDMRQPLALSLAGRLGRGSYAIHGKTTPQPLNADLRIVARGVDIAALQSLISVPLNVRIGSALLSLDGRLAYRDRGRADARIDYRGSATLGRVRVQDKLTGDDFLRWHSLAASGLVVRLGDGAPHADIGGLALSDFYARLIVNSSGRLNLQDVVASQSGAAPVSVTRAEKSPAPPAASSATAPESTVPVGAAPEIQIGQITLARGQLNYTDNFIKPNYTANITDLGGSIGAFGTGEGPPAALVLQGKLDENSPVDIGGSINPIAPVAFLDIKAKANGVELSHLSPYSDRYAGYPITGGVLNVDVHYQLDHRKLTADNHIFIDQLSFGDRSNAPGASHLPVKLAVALLKNAQGQIDVHVPVSGSLDDPKFSMAGLIWHALGNLIVRAVTSPFRLLASIGGGKHPDLGYVTFAPGSAVLDAAAQSRLAALVKLLQQKPSLKLDITGRMDPAFDEKGLRKTMVDDLVRNEKADHDGDKANPAELKLAPDEYQHYLAKVYKHAKFPKPRNLIGLTKSQPPEVMHQLLEANMPVNATALRRLAERRAEAVHQWLHGKIDEQRLVLHPPLLDGKGITDKGKTTRVDFGLH